MIGAKRAFELKSLQDRLPPFSMAEARETIQNNLGQSVEELFKEFGEPVAAASIAQVHKATTRDGKQVAVKILRPGVEKRFADDLSSFFFAARMMERFSREAQRLRPVAAVEMLDHSMKLELDLRMEASAISEMAKATADDPNFQVGPELEDLRGPPRRTGPDDRTCRQRPEVDAQTADERINRDPEFFRRRFLGKAVLVHVNALKSFFLFCSETVPHFVKSRPDVQSLGRRIFPHDL